MCGQRDGEEYGGGGAGLQAGHHVNLPSISLVGVLGVAIQWEKSNFWGPRGLENPGKIDRGLRCGALEP